MTQESSKAKDESSKAKASAKTEKDRAAKQQSAEPSETEQSDVFESDMKKLEDAGENTEELRRQYLLRRFWQTAFRFWTTPGRHAPGCCSGALLTIILLNVAAAYAMNLWNRGIFDALEKKDAATVLYAVDDLFRDPGRQRLLQRRPGLYAHDPAAALAQMAHR